MTDFPISNGQNDALMRFHTKVTEFRQQCDKKVNNLMSEVLKLKTLLLQSN
jgi:hypothetical protein